MKEITEISGSILSEGTERLKATAEIDLLQMREEAVEQSEMNAFEQAATPETGVLEQQEMDHYSDDTKLGRHGTIYDPEPRAPRTFENREAPENRRLGEYRIFADTRPRGSRYDIFADGNGK